MRSASDDAAHRRHLQKARAGARGGRATWSKYTADEMGERVRDGQLARFLDDDEEARAFRAKFKVERVPTNLSAIERRRMARHRRRAWLADLGARRRRTA